MIDAKCIILGTIAVDEKNDIKLIDYKRRNTFIKLENYDGLVKCKFTCFQYVQPKYEISIKKLVEKGCDSFGNQIKGKTVLFFSTESPGLPGTYTFYKCYGIIIESSVLFYTPFKYYENDGSNYGYITFHCTKDDIIHHLSPTGFMSYKKMDKFDYENIYDPIDTKKSYYIIEITDKYSIKEVICMLEYHFDSLANTDRLVFAPLSSVL
jgi:hypothetical protein